jgi:predicted O-linked N-acetylglucosamine transferase (SPINDLY family)
MLGLIALQQGLVGEAFELIDRAVELDDSVAVFHSNRAAVLVRMDRFAEAAESCRKALVIRPHYADAQANLGLSLWRTGHIEKAEQALMRALELAPNHPDAALHLAGLRREQGRSEEAADGYVQALRLRPSDTEAYQQCAQLMLSLKRYDEAADLLAHALALEPENHILWNNLGNAYWEQGQTELTKNCFRQALRLRPSDHLTALRAEALCPTVFETTDEIDAYRTRLAEVLEQYAEKQWSAPLAAFGSSNANPSFHLTYHGRADRPLKEAYARVFEGRLPQPQTPEPGSGLPRIGVVVTRSHEGIFLRSLADVLRRFTPGLAQIVIAGPPESAEQIRKAIPGPHIEYLPLPNRLDQAAEALLKARFDLLYYFEVNSDSFNYFLATLRLAPVQATGYGVQATTGLTNMDAYISSRPVETAEAQDHYTERLVLLETLASYQLRPRVPTSAPTRSHFKLPEFGRLYLCAQNLLKFHPDFDPVMGEILRLDRQGFIVITAGNIPSATNRLRERFSRTIGDVAPRVLFIPRQKRREYLALLSRCEVVLDPLYFGGVNTTYDALGLGKPVVTLPGEWQKSRYTDGCYQVMGFPHCTAKSPEHYVELAVRLGLDSDYRRWTNEQILAASGPLFNNDRVVREYERVFLELVEAGRQGRVRQA